jgi:hypothetical protein
MQLRLIDIRPRPEAGAVARESKTTFSAGVDRNDSPPTVRGVSTTITSTGRRTPARPDAYSTQQLPIGYGTCLYLVDPVLFDGATGRFEIWFRIDPSY